MSATNVQAYEAEELNLQELQAALRRRWRYILTGIALGGLAATWTNSITKPTWEGGFEIVLSSGAQGGNLSGALSSIPSLANLAGLQGVGGKNGELQTDVKILQSPSVLRPVFDVVRARKAALGEDVAAYKFKSWVDNIELRIEKGTSVLSVSYRDTNKNEILPVLRSITDAYQNYSTRERNESLDRAIKYTEEQAQIYRKLSDASFRALNSFGLTYGIASTKPGGGAGAGGIDISQLLSSSNSNVAALNIGGNSGSSATQNSANPLAQLALLNQELMRKQQRFTDKDPSIIALRRERNALQRYIESSAFGSIAYPGKLPISKETAQNVLIRHEELERKANRDQSTLASLEGALLSLQMQRARDSTPWQLISTPTLLDQPVAPHPTRTLVVGLASGVILGCAAALIVDQRSGRIFNKEKLKELLPTELLLELQSDKPHKWNDGLRLLGLGKAQGGSIAILPIGELQQTNMEKVRDILKQTCNTHIEICRSTLEATKFDKLLLLASPGSIKTYQLDRLMQELGLQTTPVVGWIWLD